MKRRITSRSVTVVLACACFALAAAAYGQGHPGGGGGGGNPGGGNPGGGGPGGGGPGGMGGMGGGLNRPSFPAGNSGTFPGTSTTGSPRSSPPPGGLPSGKNPTDSTMAGGLQLGPSGRWWDDSSFAKTLGIDSKQQHRMDDVFNANRGALLKLYKDLKQEEKQLAKTVRAKELDESAIFAQIDRVTQARGELEKANAHYLLQIRKEMSAEQTAKLDEHRPDLE